MSASPTTQRDLPAGRSIRIARRDLSVTSAPLTCNISRDVVVTGSGISGVVDRGGPQRRGGVVILDRRGPGAGPGCGRDGDAAIRTRHADGGDGETDRPGLR